MEGFDSSSDGRTGEKALISKLFVGKSGETADGIEHQALCHRQFYSIIYSIICCIYSIILALEQTDKVALRSYHTIGNEVEEDGFIGVCCFERTYILMAQNGGDDGYGKSIAKQGKMGV